MAFPKGVVGLHLSNRGGEPNTKWPGGCTVNPLLSVERCEQLAANGRRQIFCHRMNENAPGCFVAHLCLLPANRREPSGPYRGRSADLKPGSAGCGRGAGCIPIGWSQADSPAPKVLVSSLCVVCPVGRSVGQRCGIGQAKCKHADSRHSTTPCLTGGPMITELSPNRRILKDPILTGSRPLS